MNPKHTGLSTTDAHALHRRYGANKLPEKPPPSNLSIFLAQFKSSLVYVLLFAGIVTLVMGHYSDSIIIMIAVTINTVLGYLQESKANNSLSALKKYVTQHSEVIRDGERKKVLSASIVPGDIVVLAQGTKVPADGELIEVNRFFVDEAILTGESVQVVKEIGGGVFMGTTVTTGRALMRVTKIGSETKMGGIASDIQDDKEDTPLKRQLTDFSKKLVYVILLAVFIVYVAGVVRGESVVQMFTTAVALAVASIPEGLLISLTVILAIGMQKILNRQGLVRKLASAETLGGVTTICVDKTGTLTEGKMKVVDVLGDEDRLAKQVVLANDLDDPIVIAAHGWGVERVSKADAKRVRVDSIPFSPVDKYFACMVERDDKTHTIFLNGAPEVILAKCDVTKQEKKRVEKMIDELATQGKRVLGFALKKVRSDKRIIEKSDLKSEFEWVGMIGFFDPVRKGVKEALMEAHKAGIRVVTITGDYPKNTEAVLSEIGMPVKKSEIMLGEELIKLSKTEIAKKARHVRLFARTTPDQKLKIVQALKESGEIVAMMGDGVNDAPAIHAADIGVVVGEASDVARESADLVLLNSNFSVVVSAIEEGRAIFDNIRKVIMYLVSASFSEITIVIGGILLGLPLPLTAVQILWINLVTDSLPNLALTIDPKRQNLMDEKPRDPSEKLIARWMILLVGVVSVGSGVLCLVYFSYIWGTTMNLELARSVVFVTMGFKSLSYVFSVRMLMVPAWRGGFWDNKYLFGAVAMGAVLQTIPFWSADIRAFFGVSMLEPIHWVVSVLLSLTIFGFVEFFKFGYSQVRARKI
jgi:P-type Ca2+ transporter type 2C